MSNIEELLNYSGGSAISMAYLLIMANVLGLTVYMENKSYYPSVTKMTDKKPLQSKETMDRSNSEDDPMDIAETSLSKENQTTEIVSQELPSVIGKKVIDSSDIPGLKENEMRNTVKPLVWRFPN